MTAGTFLVQIKKKKFWLETLPCVYGGKKSSFMYECEMKNVFKKNKSSHAETWHAVEWCSMTKCHPLKSCLSYFAKISISLK